MLDSETQIGVNEMTSRLLSVPDISCGHCKDSIEGAVAPLEGVETVEVAIEDRTVAINFNGSHETFSAVVDAIEAQGYEVAE